MPLDINHLGYINIFVGISHVLGYQSFGIWKHISWFFSCLLILIIGDLSTYLLIFVHLGVDAASAAGIVRADQPVPCRGVEEELVPVNLLPNWATVDEQVWHLRKPAVDTCLRVELKNCETCNKSHKQGPSKTCWYCLWRLPSAGNDQRLRKVNWKQKVSLY